MADRRLTALVLTPLAFTLLAQPVDPARSARSASTATSVAAGIPFDPAPLTGRCHDPAGSWLGMKWSTAFRWHLNATSAPRHLATDQKATVIAAATTAANTISTGRNDCGGSPLTTIRQRYLGTTAHVASITHDGRCGQRDQRNVVSFGRLPPGMLAVTCVWWNKSGSSRRSVEADLLVSDLPGLFFVSPPATCGSQWDLESVLTHEFGHIYGLGHVSFAQHSSLTMSDALPECSTIYRALGFGDYLALRRHYAVPDSTLPR